VSERMPWWRRVRGNREVASCMEVGRVLQAYLDGHVDELTARRVGRHLEMCRRCGLEAETYTQIKTALARRGDVDPEAVARLRAFGQSLMDSDPDESASDAGDEEV